jgi:hypothetical protein
MRTLILLCLCTACAILSVIECPDRKNQRTVLMHVAVGIFIGWLIFRLLVFVGLFNRT